MRSETLLAAMLEGIAVRDREKFAEDMVEVLYATSEAHGLRAFWELAVRWEPSYPAVVQLLQQKLGRASWRLPSV